MGSNPISSAKNLIVELHKTEILPPPTPTEMINEVVMIALSRVLMRVTKGDERRFSFQTVPSIDELSRKTELNLEGMCLEMSLNTAYELLNKHKDVVQEIFLVNSFLGKGAYKENTDFMGHSYVITKIDNRWYGISAANYKANSAKNFTLIEGQTLDTCLRQITDISGAQWPDAADFPDAIGADAFVKENKENAPDFVDEIASVSIPVVQRNTDGTYSESRLLSVFMRRNTQEGDSRLELFKYKFANFH